MPKKRKTRREKTRSRPKAVAAVPKAKSSAPAVKPKVQSDTQTVVEVDPQHRTRVKTMKFSLIVFASLAFLQLTLWWLLRNGFLPQTWIDLLLG